MKELLKKALKIILAIIIIILIGIAGNSDMDEYIEVNAKYNPNYTRVLLTK